MMIKNIFDKQVSDEIIERINQLKSDRLSHWGKMSVDQMLAHCNVTYKYTFEPEAFEKPSTFKKFLLKLFVKKIVVSEKSYQRNGRTAPDFVMVGSKDFEIEKAKLIQNINKAQELGQNHFEGLENFSFGKMTAKEWNNMFYKHLDHHLKQFGV